MKSSLLFSAFLFTAASAPALQVSAPLFVGPDPLHPNNLPVAMMPDGRIAAVTASPPPEVVVGILNRDGTTARSWPAGQIGFVPERVLPLPDGGIVITGFAGGFGGGQHRFRIYNADGTARTPAAVTIANGGLQEGNRLLQVLPGGRFIFVWDSPVNSQGFNTPFGEAPGIGPIYPAPFNQYGRDIYARIFHTADGTPAPNAHSPAGDTFVITQGMYENDPAWPGVRWDTRIEEQWLLDLDLTAAGTLRVTYQGPRWFGNTATWSRHWFALFRGLDTSGAQFIAEEPFSQQAAIADATMQNAGYRSKTVPLANGRMACIYDEGYAGHGVPRLTLRYFEENGQPVDNGPREPSGAPFGKAFPLFSFTDTNALRQIDAHPYAGASFVIFFTATPEGAPTGGPRHAVAAVVDGNGRVTDTVTIASSTMNQVIHWVAPGQPGEWFVSLTEGTRGVANEGGSNHRIVRVFDRFVPRALSAGLSLSQAAADDDPDSDLVPNLVELATGSAMLAANAQPLEISPSAPTGTEFYFPRDTAAAADGFTVQMERSTDGTTWTTAGLTETIVSTTGTVQRIKVAVPPAQRAFFRLKARQ